MKVKLLTQYSSPLRQISIGAVVDDLPDAEAQALVDGGFAVLMSAPVVETAAVSPVIETAVAPAAKRQRKG